MENVSVEMGECENPIPDLQSGFKTASFSLPRERNLEQSGNTMSGEILTLTRLRISQADPSDLDLVLGILDEATNRLLKNGMPTAWEPGKFSRQAFLDQIMKGEVFVAYIGEEATGTFILQWSDLLWWGERPPDAGYIHKFAIKPALAGKGLGVEMLKWAETTARNAGRKFLRLNCMADDRKMRDYYERLGFIHKGDAMGPKCLGSLYEKPL